jgi:hypothetical protein
MFPNYHFPLFSLYHRSSKYSMGGKQVYCVDFCIDLIWVYKERNQIATGELDDVSSLILRAIACKAYEI